MRGGITMGTTVMLLAALQIWLHRREACYQRQHFSSRRAKAHGYAIAKLRVTAIAIAIEALFVIVMINLGLAQLYDLFAWLGLAEWIVQWAVFVSTLLLIAAVKRSMTLVLIWLVERRFGYTNQHMGVFLKDTLLKAALLFACGGSLGLVSIQILQQGWSTGWIWLVLIWSGFVWGRSWLYPVIIAPLFNRYQSLNNPELADAVRAIGQSSGVPVHAVLIMDGSRRSSHGNAHVTGHGSSRRVVLLDTLDSILDQAELLAVVAHEIGHIRHGHMLYYQLCQFLTSTIWIGLFGFWAGRVGIDPGTGLALLWLLAPIVAFLVKPLFSGLIRKFEYQADAFAASKGHGVNLGRALIKLLDNNGATYKSDPCFSWIYHTHPLLDERLASLDQQTVSPANQVVEGH
jgi:STE24 endopeptidase